MCMWSSRRGGCGHLSRQESQSTKCLPWEHICVCGTRELELGSTMDCTGKGKFLFKPLDDDDDDVFHYCLLYKIT